MATSSSVLYRRAFLGQLAAGAVLAPFASWVGSRRARAAAAASAAPRRLIVVSSLGTDKTLWLPSTGAGGALQLPTMLAPLGGIADQLVLLDGLSFPNPTEGHSTPQTLTGFTFANGYGPTCTSVDQYLAAKLGGSWRLPSLLLGWQAKGEAQFWSAGKRLTTLDSPSDAWQSAFGGVSVAAVSKAAVDVSAARNQVWQMVQKQAEQMAAGLSGDAKTRVLEHANAVAALLTRGSAPSLGASCTVPAQPTLGGLDPNADAQQEQVSAAHADLIAAALACDVTRIVGMQFGVSNRQYMGGTVNDDEHSAIHSGDSFKPEVIGAETAMCNWLVKLAQTLKATPDPLASGSTLLDNTLIVWTRDIGHGPAHTQYSMPYVLVGGGTYLSKQTTGRYVNLGGDEASQTVGAPHQRLLLNLIEYMGAGNGGDFGTVSSLASADRAPLTQIKA